MVYSYYYPRVITVLASTAQLLAKGSPAPFGILLFLLNPRLLLELGRPRFLRGNAEKERERAWGKGRGDASRTKCVGPRWTPIG